MSKKKKGKIVYSTEPDYFDFDDDEEIEEGGQDQDLRVWRQRIKGNKMITLIKGYSGPDSEIKELAKHLRHSCGTGGNVKDGEILIQGDHADKVCKLLIEKGHKAKRAGA